MKNLIRLGNKNVPAGEVPAIEVLKNSIKLNTSGCILLGAVPGSSRIDVGVDGKGKGAEIYITVISDTTDTSTGRLLSKNSTLNSASIKSVLAQFETDNFTISDEKSLFDGETWYRILPQAPSPVKSVPVDALPEGEGDVYTDPDDDTSAEEVEPEESEFGDEEQIELDRN